MAEEENCMNLRLLINKKTQRILYAEAGKDLVDLLFSFLLLPTGAVIKLLADNKYPDKVGCLTNLYNSVDKLQPRYMSGDKSELLHPKIGRAPTNFSTNMLPIQAPSESNPVTAKYYICSNYSTYHYSSNSHDITNQHGSACRCGSSMNVEVQLNNPVKTVSATKHSGYVKETATFIITDDLSISPSTTITSIALLNKLNVRDLADLEEQNVVVGFNEALELLTAAMVSKTALNEVFSVESPSTDA
eukprot:Gb_20221 [translate_table: standard]